jgi:hypothetical protein
MLPTSSSTSRWLCRVPLVFGAILAIETGCSSGGDKNNDAIGGANSGGTQTGGTHSSGASSTTPSGGASTKATGGASTLAMGGSSCIPASTDIPADHPTDGPDTQPCSGCHATAIAGGFVFDPSGSVPVSGATVTLKPTSGASMTAITGSKGMFRFPGDLPAPFEACVSKCPDTACSTASDHQSAGDCGTCHGLTTPKIHLP